MNIINFKTKNEKNILSISISLLRLLPQKLFFTDLAGNTTFNSTLMTGMQSIIVFFILQLGTKICFASGNDAVFV